MREILFKAKAINRDKGYHRTNYKNGDWVYGLITRLYDERFECLPAEMTDENGVSGIEIDHNTICQYTGLTDKNGNKIFENDLIECKEFSDGHLKKHFLSQVEWDDTGTGFTFKYSNNGWVFMDSLTVYECEVIGNIFDNPKLIGGCN